MNNFIAGWCCIGWQVITGVLIKNSIKVKELALQIPPNVIR